MIDLGSIKISNISGRSLENCIIVNAFGGGSVGNIIEVFMGSEGIRFILSTISLLNVDHRVRCFFKMTMINITTNGVSNEEDFRSLRSRQATTLVSRRLGSGHWLGS